MASARRQGVRLEVDLPDDDRLAVLGSSDDLARALSNLTTMRSAIPIQDCGTA